MKKNSATTTSNRGKAAEAAVMAYLNSLSASVAEFNFSRLYDARSAGGRFPAQAGDFQFFRPMGATMVHGLIEVKEVEHDYRLPSKNFKPGQLGKLEMRRMAGGEIIILISHTTTKLWRRPPFKYLWDRAGQASWDFREFKTYPDVAAALAGVKATSRSV